MMRYFALLLAFLVGTYAQTPIETLLSSPGVQNITQMIAQNPSIVEQWLKSPPQEFLSILDKFRNGANINENARQFSVEVLDKIMEPDNIGWTGSINTKPPTIVVFFDAHLVVPALPGLTITIKSMSMDILERKKSVRPMGTARLLNPPVPFVPNEKLRLVWPITPQAIRDMHFSTLQNFVEGVQPPLWGKNLQFELEVEPVPVLAKLHPVFAKPFRKKFHFEPGLLPDFSATPPPLEDKELKARLKGLSGIEKAIEEAKLRKQNKMQHKSEVSSQPKLLDATGSISEDSKATVSIIIPVACASVMSVSLAVLAVAKRSAMRSQDRLAESESTGTLPPVSEL